MFLIIPLILVFILKKLFHKLFEKKNLYMYIIYIYVSNEPNKRSYNKKYFNNKKYFKSSCFL